MNAPEVATLSREVRGIQIPEGLPILLPAGSQVRITQSLGGNYTVATDQGYLVRIEERDADAIGKEAPLDGGLGEGATLEEKIWARLRTCFDPEIPVNIVDLGLVYNCQVEEKPEGDSRVQIQMTLTAPGCGMGPVLAQDVKDKVEAIPGVAEADVEVVFDPQWNPTMMTEAARLQLGMF
jgi:probable FeS assembly SUF system protein SufT